MHGIERSAGADHTYIIHKTKYEVKLWEKKRNLKSITVKILLLTLSKTGLLLVNYINFKGIIKKVDSVFVVTKVETSNSVKNIENEKKKDFYLYLVRVEFSCVCVCVWKIFDVRPNCARTFRSELRYCIVKTRYATTHTQIERNARTEKENRWLEKNTISAGSY